MLENQDDSFFSYEQIGGGKAPTEIYESNSQSKYKYTEGTRG